MTFFREKSWCSVQGGTWIVGASLRTTNTSLVAPGTGVRYNAAAMHAALARPLPYQLRGDEFVIENEHLPNRHSCCLFVWCAGSQVIKHAFARNDSGITEGMNLKLFPVIPPA